MPNDIDLAALELRGAAVGAAATPLIRGDMRTERKGELRAATL
jgi:hypothetical protein